MNVTLISIVVESFAGGGKLVLTGGNRKFERMEI